MLMSWSPPKNTRPRSSKTAGRGCIQGKDLSRGAKGHLLTGRQVGRRDARYAVGIIRGRSPLIDSESEAERLRISALGRGKTIYDCKK